jgi:flagellar biosynthesis protein FlhB
MTEAKIHPPSRSRIAEARAAGLAPRPLLLGLSACLFALASSLHASGSVFAEDLVSLLGAPLDAFAQGHTEAALGLAATLSARIAKNSALFAFSAFACSAIALILAQGLQLSMPRADTRRFSAPRLSLEASSLAVVGVLALGFLHVGDALWLVPSQLPAFSARVLDQLAVLFFALAIVDASFARAQFFRALFSTRRELREEQREAYGAPELRAARAAARERPRQES